MRVLIFTQHYTPEVTAARFRVQPFAEALAQHGHDVEVIAAVPNHPEGVIHEEYRGRPLVRRRVDGVDASYVWVWTSPRKTVARRLAYYGSYAAMATIVGASVPRPDVTLATSPPLSVGAAAALAAARHRVPWVLDVRDIWPEVAVTLGELRSRPLIRAAERLERWLYRRAAAIVTVTEPFRRAIAGRAPAGREVVLIPNGTTRLWLEAGGREVEREPLGLPSDRFVWAYAGNIGLFQALGTAVEAAGILGEGFQLLIIGAGPMRASIEEQASRLPAGCVGFRDLMPPEMAARYLRASDALLVSQRRDLTTMVSSKLFDYCALGRPVIAAAEGEMRRLAEHSGGALPVPAADPAALASAVRRLREDAGLRDAFAERGRAFAAEHLRERQAERLVDLLESLAHGRAT